MPIKVKVRSVPNKVVSPSRFRLIRLKERPISKENTVTRIKVTSSSGRYWYSFSIYESTITGRN